MTSAAALELAGSHKTVFKVNTGRLPFSENTSEGCVYCYAGRPPGTAPLPLCAGCTSVRYCNKQHQIAHWPEHKAFCKAQRNTWNGRAGTKEMSLLQEMRYLIEDWTALHRKSIEEGLAWALHEFCPPYDFHNKYAHFMLRYRPESEGNPSLAFGLVSVRWCGSPVAGEVDSFSVLLGQIEKTHEGDKALPGYMSAVPCLYVIEGVLGWWSVQYIFARSIPGYRPAGMPFYYGLLYCSREGVVFRLEGDNLCDWVPGLMSKHASGTKWVWKKHTVSELAAKGIVGFSEYQVSRSSLSVV